MSRYGDRGIRAAGTYVPGARIDAETVEDAWGDFAARGVESTAVPAADEDAITMAIAAAEDALDPDLDRESIVRIAFATTTPPLEEEELAPRIVAALGLSHDLSVRCHAQSTLAGAHALEDALAAEGPALAVAADCPRGDPADADHAFGAGAAAFLIDDDAPVRVRGIANHVVDAPGLRYRTRGDEDVRSIGVTGYERGVRRERVTAALDALEVDDVHGAAIDQPDGSAPYRAVGDRLDAETVERGFVADRIGDAGAAGVPLGLVRALSDADSDDVTVAAFFASGAGATAIAFEGGLVRGFDPRGERELSYEAYLRRRGHLGDGEVSGGGANVSLPTWQRSIEQRYRLVGGRCPDCGAVAFPPEGACPSCHALVEYEPVELPRRGEVVARTTIGRGGAPPEFAAYQRRQGPFAVALVELGEVTIPAQVVETEEVAIGDEVRATIRRLYDQEGLPRYGVKFVPMG